MRKNKDGVVIGEHLFYKMLSEQNVTLEFMNINSVKAELFQYNFKNYEITRMDKHIDINNNICKVSINDTSEECIYFLMYEYD